MNDALTTIQNDATWKSRTHPGLAYAALLVTDGYHPRAKTDALPEKGGPVLAVAMAEGAKPLATGRKKILFAGYDFQARETPTDSGGTPNNYDPANASTREAGLST